MEQKTQDLNHSTGQTFWRNYKKLFRHSSNSQIGVLIDHGVLVTDDKKRADILFKDFFSGNHLQSGTFDDNFYQQITQQVDSISRSEETCQPYDETTEYDLNVALREVNSSSKGEDPDGIHPAALKHIGPNLKELLLTLFNRALASSRWPFGNNEVVFIPKSGKDSYLKTSSYRPITKSSYVGKLLERILKNAIIKHLNSNNLDDPRQEGFRKRKSTARYITDLLHSIQLAWSAKQAPVAVTVDLEKAFNSVWVDGLLWVHHEKIVPIHCYSAVDVPGIFVGGPDKISKLTVVVRNTRVDNLQQLESSQRAVGNFV